MITYEINILCDGEGCKETDEVLTTDAVEPTDAGAEILSELARHQWSVINGKHLCPRCFIIAKGKGQEPT